VKRRTLLFTLAFSVLGCSRPVEPAKTNGLVPAGTPDPVNVALAREKQPPRAFSWAPWSKQTFERAKRERKFILLHGAAAWCHWCHVMEETTYRDPEVGRILRERFIAIKVDIDSRPDIEDRYGEWGWPATILFSPDAAEVGKFRGYLPPDEMREVLGDIERAALGAGEDRALEEPGPHSATVEALPWVALRVTHDMDYYYDAKEGGWGMRQKAPLGENAEVEVRRAAHGDKAARTRLLFSLKKQRALLDPVWGGIYQYSAASHWKEPHFEKLMSFQAPNLEAYSRAYALTKQADLKRDADSIVRYVDRFMTSPAGTFYTNQDADVGSHDPKARFVDGNVYYRKNEAGRLALGVPWIDKHVYARENGAMIAALVAYGEAGGERGLERARRAATALLSTHVAGNGNVVREPGTSSSVRYLADAASLGRALALLAEVGKESAFRDAALRIGERLVADLMDESTAALFAHTPDPDSHGVFSQRRRPFAHNVSAARFFSALFRLTSDEAWQTRARRVLAAIATPAALDERGRMVGEYLLALDEAGVYPWRVNN
jgi:uncharacterized protein YyaL (SSP411 family)